MACTVSSRRKEVETPENKITLQNVVYCVAPFFAGSQSKEHPGFRWHIPFKLWVILGGGASLVTYGFGFNDFHSIALASSFVFLACYCLACVSEPVRAHREFQTLSLGHWLDNPARCYLVGVATACSAGSEGRPTLTYVASPSRLGTFICILRYERYVFYAISWRSLPGYIWLWVLTMSICRFLLVALCSWRVTSLFAFPSTRGLTADSRPFP